MSRLLPDVGRELLLHFLAGKFYWIVVFLYRFCYCLAHFDTMKRLDINAILITDYVNQQKLTLSPGRQYFLTPCGPLKLSPGVKLKSVCSFVHKEVLFRRKGWMCCISWLLYAIAYFKRPHCRALSTSEYGEVHIEPWRFLYEGFTPFFLSLLPRMAILNVNNWWTIDSGKLNSVTCKE